MVGPKAAPGLFYWVSTILLLLWALGGASIYIALYFEGAERFAQTAETAENRAAYAEYVAHIPWWAIAAGIVAAVTRLGGALALLLRRAWALPLYVVSAIFFAVALYRAFFLADVASVMSPGHIAVEALFLSLSLFAIWFSFSNSRNGVLR
jgi:hypothetical protein